MTRTASSRLALVAALFAVAATPAAAGPAACETKVERVSRGRWEARPVDGIEAPTESRVAVDEREPGFVVVADLAGVLVTRDGGCTWKRALQYADFLFPFEGIAVDATVAGTGADRTLHVLVAPWGPFTPYLQPVLLSSDDDGATWTTMDVPPASGPAAYGTYSLAATPGSPDALFLLVVRSAASAVYEKSETGWRWRSAGGWTQPETCVPDGPCPARTMQTLYADPRHPGALWAQSVTPDGESMARSKDSGTSWEYRPVPPLTGGASLMAVAPSGAILLVGDFFEFALSTDDARSWMVGDVPKLASSSTTSVGVSGVASFDRSAFAVVPGVDNRSPWAGNVLVFDGSRWRDVSPALYAGYDRTDADGRRRTIVELAGTRGPLLALTSAGDLMTYRR